MAGTVSTSSEPDPIATTCVHAGAASDVTDAGDTPPLVAPIYQAAVFETPTLDLVAGALDGEAGLYSYSRVANPTVAAWERAMATLEGAEDAVAAASGMGAITGVLFGLLRPGQRLVSTLALYGTTKKLLDTHLVARGIEVLHRPADQLLAEGLPAETDMLYTETIANPLLEVADLPALAKLAAGGGALLVVDNTFATPYHCRPLTLGADLVIHSASKYLGGHADLIAGVACGRAELVKGARAAIQALGATPAPLESWLALRGVRTLAVRLERQAANAAQVAAYLADRTDVAAVWYPGLAAEPAAEVAQRVLLNGHGAMVSFRLPGERMAIARFLGALRMIRFAASLGDVSTTVSHPATTSHRGLPPGDLAAAGIDEGVLRLSVGLERIEDILADLGRGLEAAADVR